MSLAESQLSILKGKEKLFTENRLDNVFRTIVASPHKDDIAILFEDSGVFRKHSFSEVDKITNKFARVILRMMKNKTFSKNDDGNYIIAVKMYPSDYLLMVLLAIWKTGAAYLPLDHEFPKYKIDYIIGDAKPVMTIYDEESHFQEGVPTISLTELLKNSDNEPANDLDQKEKIFQTSDDLAIVLYTSGSSGIPKGVRLPHKVILNRLEWQYWTFPFGDEETICIFKTALTFGDSIAEIWGPFLKHRSVLVIPRTHTKNPDTFLNILAKFKIQRLILVPSFLETLLIYMNSKMNKIRLDDLKLWVCSGEMLKKSLVEEFYRYFTKEGHKLCNFYGSTEVMADVTYYVHDGFAEIGSYDKVPIGRPIDNTIIYLLDEDLQPVNLGERGEIFVSGSNLAAGYVNGSHSARRFLSNPFETDLKYSKLFRTGDFARIAEGNLVYEGRVDSQVKIGGRRVDLSEIEEALSSLDEVEKSVVLCDKPGTMNQAILAFVVVKNHEKNGLQIEVELKKLLVWYMIPEVVIVEQFPLLVSGKIDRQTLLKLYEDMAGDEDFISYEGIDKDQREEAKVLFETILSFLGRRRRSKISVGVNFYEIGGNSLNSICIISSLIEKGHHIRIDDFIRAKNLGEILSKMKSAINNSTPDGEEAFVCEPLKDEHRKIITDIITKSFLRKSDLFGLLENLSVSDFEKMIDAKWKAVIEANLSFVAKSLHNEIIGVCINYDARNAPIVEIETELNVIGEFLEFIEGPIRDNQLPPGIGTVLYSSVVTTHWSLPHQDNIAAMLFMENEALNLAKRSGFIGVFTTNISELTQQLARDVLKYQTMLDYQVNQYVDSNGTKPFATAPDSQRAIVGWKKV